MARGTPVTNRNRFLTDEQCAAVHAGSCALLENVGVALEHEKAIQIFRESGATYQDGRMRIPRSMVEKAVESTAKRIVLQARNPENAVVVDPRNEPLVHFGTGGQALNVLHYESGAFVSKPAVTDDLATILRICERLPNVDFMTRPVEPDVAEDEMDLAKTRMFMRYTTKHMNLANLVQVDKLDEVLATVEDPDRVSFISCLLVSPLTMVTDTVEKFMHLVEKDLAVSISSCPQAGATAPLSEVGSLVQVNAEVLSAVVLANLIRPGAKVLCRGLPITANLYADGSPRWCQPDSIRRLALMAEMTYHYGIPCCGTAGVSDEKEPTAQAISEKTLSWVFEFASGAQFINSALGMLEQVLTVSPVQYVIDDMILSRVRELFASEGADDLRGLACRAVEDALGLFGLPAPAGEIATRVDYVLTQREAASPQTVDEQVEAIGKAVLSGQSSTAFMRGARKGLRKGLLYQGQRIEGKPELRQVHETSRRLASEEES